MDLLCLDQIKSSPECHARGKTVNTADAYINACAGTRVEVVGNRF